MSRLEALKIKAEELRPQLDQATLIVQKAAAEGREQTPEELAITEPAIARGNELTAALRQARADEALTEKARIWPWRWAGLSASPTPAA